MSKLKTIPREEPVERDAETVAAELAAVREELGAADLDFERLREERKAALLSATIDQVAAFDGKLARADVRHDIAFAKIAVLEAELSKLLEADDGLERERNLERAHQLAAEAEKLITITYSRHAGGIATVLDRLAEIRHEVRELNGRLPPGVAAIDPEEFRGFSRSLADIVRLPSVTAAEQDYWPPRRAPARVDINQIYART